MSTYSALVEMQKKYPYDTRIGKEIFEIGMINLFVNHRYFSNVLIQCNKEIDTTMMYAMGVYYNSKINTFVIVYNPILLARCGLEEYTSTLIHEVYHIINHHTTFRMTDSIPTNMAVVANLACDAAINEFVPNIANFKGWVTVDSLNKKLPKGVVLEHKETSEYYYKILSENKDSPAVKPFLDNAQVDQLLSELKEALGNQDADKVGGILDKLEKLGVKMVDAHSIDGENSNGEMASNLALQMLNRAKQLTDAKRGTIPGNISEILAKLNAPAPLKWQTEVRRTIGRVRVPYVKTRNRLNRRQPDRRDLRGKRMDRFVKVVVALDTSGSMGDNVLLRCLGEIQELVRHVPNTVTVIECDARVNRTYDLKGFLTPDAFIITGRGGTAFSPVFKYVEEEGLEPDLLIYFTDGYGESVIETKKKINYNILWVVTNNVKNLTVSGMGRRLLLDIIK